MKGRRKRKTDKWLIRRRFIEQSRAVLASRADGRFLNIAAHTFHEEPAGVLAGGSSMSTQPSSAPCDPLD